MLAWFQRRGEGPLVAVDIGTRMIKAVVLKKGAERPVLSFAQIERLPEDVIVGREFVDRGAVVEVLAGVETSLGAETRRAIAGIGGRGILVRRESIPITRGQKKEEALGAYVRSLPGQDVDVLYDFVELARTESSIEGVLVVARSEAVGDTLYLLRDAGFDPMVVDYEGLALLNFYQGLQILPATGTYGILHIGYEITYFSVVQEGRPVALGEMEPALKFFADGLTRLLGLSLEDALRAVRGDIPESVSEDSVRTGLESVRNTFVDDVHARFSRIIEEGTRLDGLFLSGGGATVQGLAQALEARFGVPVTLVNALDYVDNQTPLEHEAGYLLPVAVGMALRSIQPAPYRINLIPEEERLAAEEAALPIPRPDLVIPLAFLVVGGLVIAGGWWTRRSRIRDLEVKVMEMQEELDLRRARLGNLADLRQKKEVLSRKIETIRNLRRDQTRAVEEVNALIRALPPGVWLESVQDQGQQVSLTGGAYHYAAIAEYLRRLRLSEVFTRVRFVEAREEQVEGLGVFRFSFVLSKRGAAAPR